MEERSKYIERINSLAKHLGLSLHVTPEEFFSKRTKPLFTSLADSRDGKVIFRFAFENLLESLRKESALYSAANKMKISIVPQLLDFEDGEDWNWLTYKYCEGASSGNVYQFSANQDYNSLLHLIEGIDGLQKLQLDTNLFRSRQPESWHRLINTIVAKKPELMQEQMVANAVSALKQSACPASDCFVHGDMHPGNIILNGDSVVVIDWESAHFDCYGFDTSFLYIRSYDVNFRGRLIEHIQKNNAQKLHTFYYVLVVNLLRDYFEWHLAQEGKNELLGVDEVLNGRTPEDVIEELRLEIENYYKLIQE